MLLKLKSEVFSYIPLSFLNSLIYKLLHMATIEANQVVMMLTLIQLIDSPAITFAGLKMATYEQPCLLNLSEDKIDRGKTDFLILFG
jgi:hypothetical protein